ncbi:MAG TPA: MFS transporter [Bryobacteraceae bacterium]|nr:MFS transporter [Bryobacteraceae bacterium]
MLRWQILMVSLMVIGYSGYYLCRSNFSVALPMIIQELGTRGMHADVAQIRLGLIASLGVLAYAIGKFVAGGLSDFLGGRRTFLGGMAGSVLFTALFALSGGTPLFTLAWIGNRLVQSLGWAGVVKISSRWFSYSSYGTVMGIVSLSFLFGDAASRQFLAILIGYGFGWRSLFFTAAGVLFFWALVNTVLLKDTPQEIGEPEPPANPQNLFASGESDSAPMSIRSLLSPLLRSKVFLLVCLLSVGLTLVRETFNLWTPTYFAQTVGLSNADAAQKSALFPLFGGISVLLAGYLSDRMGKGARAAIILIGLLLAGLTLLVLAYGDFGGSRFWPVCLTALVAFLMIGPYSYLAGAIALDFGGKRGSATVSGIIDGSGYLGGVLAGDSMARISVAYGWRGAFAVLAAVCWVLSLAAAVYWLNQRRAVILAVAPAEE